MIKIKLERKRPEKRSENVPKISILGTFSGRFGFKDLYIQYIRLKVNYI